MSAPVSPPPLDWPEGVPLPAMGLTTIRWHLMGLHLEAMAEHRVIRSLGCEIDTLRMERAYACARGKTGWRQ